MLTLQQTDSQVEEEFEQYYTDSMIAEYKDKITNKANSVKDWWAEFVDTFQVGFDAYMTEVCLLSEDNYYAFIEYTDEGGFFEEMTWLYQANGKGVYNPDDIFSLAQTGSTMGAENSGSSYGYAASFTLGAAAATAYIFYTNKKQD